MSDVMHCPVCPCDSLDGSEVRCPLCRTDLSALRRVRQLPELLLQTGEELVDHEAGAAIAYVSVAVLVERTRGRALLLLGDCHIRLRNVPAAKACWRAASETGGEHAQAALDRLTTLDQESSWVVIAKFTDIRLRQFAARCDAEQVREKFRAWMQSR